MNLELDLAILKEMADELKDYLLANVLFWQMQASARFPKLSLGMMLLTRARLQAASDELTSDQRNGLAEAERRIDTTLGSWQVAAEQKAAQELKTRVNLWQRFWDDCREDGPSCAENYPHEVANRAMAGLLLHQFPRLSATPVAQSLEALDRSVRTRLPGSQFVWAAELQGGFPAQEFWYLYASPRRSPAGARTP